MSAEDPAGQFMTLFKQQAKLYRKHASGKKLPKFLWFNDSCKKAIKERKKAQRKFFFSSSFFSNPTLSNVQKI